MARAKPAPAPPPEGPDGFQIRRAASVGRHPLLEVFPGLDRLALAAKLEPKASERRRLFAETEIEVVDDDMWMYVAPREIPALTRGRWKPVVSPDVDCIVVGAGHLRESPSVMLFMDIFHELAHVRQRRGGANLWEPGVSYVKRWTEIEAYRLVVDEARRLGVDDVFLREYLKVEWISAAEHRELLATLDVPPR